jgi:lysyl-tRNA synthetase class 2
MNTKTQTEETVPAEIGKSNLAILREQRLAKAKQLREMGIDPYPAKANRSNEVSEIINNFEKFENKVVTLNGRLMSWREHGQLNFGHIMDQNGRIQLYFRSDTVKPTSKKTQTLGWDDLNLSDVGDFVEATGKIVKTQSGEISLLVETYRILTKAIRPLPDKWKGITDKETRYRRRYLDLTMNTDTREVFKRKAKFWDICRIEMKKAGFIEVETPVLEYKTGGADAKPFVTHHNDLGIDLYMRISSELYQKRLIGGGFEKVYTLGPNFRNEGVDDEHLQEYYQLEWYWAYATYKDNMKLTRDMIRELAKQIYGKTTFTSRGHTFDLMDEWTEIDYTSCIKERFGIDIFTASEAEMFKAVTDNGVKLSGVLNRNRLIDNLWKIIRKGVAGPAFLVNQPKFISPLAKSHADNVELTERFQIIIGGSELGNGYSEINDPVDQLERFREQEDARLAGDDESQMLDIDFVEMLEYGMPPTSGFAFSERLFWYLEDLSGRESTFFPLMREEIDNTTKEIYNMKDSNGGGGAVKEQDKSKKMVLVLDNKLTGWQLTNTVGHLTAYLGAKVNNNLLSRPTFTTKEGIEIPANSQYPVISMGANSGQMINLLQKVKESHLAYLMYTQDMITYSDDNELAEALKKQTLTELKIIGIGIFGDNEKINVLTKKFSLWK